MPNPLLEENRPPTIEAIKQTGPYGHEMVTLTAASFFDFIEGYYIVGLLAEAFLKKAPGQKVVHDPRLIWNTVAIAAEFSGEAVQSKTGHVFIKERMAAFPCSGEINSRLTNPKK